MNMDDQRYKPNDEKLLGSAVKMYQTLPEKKDVSYQHKVLAQTYFPYRNQKDVVKWESR